MGTYIIGFLVCEYALATDAIKKSGVTTAKDQIVSAILITAISLVWPIALAVWMRDLKGKLS